MRRRADQINCSYCPKVCVSGYEKQPMNIIFQLLRVRQWSKNLFMFAPLLFSKRLFEIESIVEVSIGLLLFLITSSCIYIFNDIRDIENDRQHHIKKTSPFISRIISVPFGTSLYILMGRGTFFVTFFIKSAFGWIFLGYIILNILY